MLTQTRPVGVRPIRDPLVRRNDGQIDYESIGYQASQFEIARQLHDWLDADGHDGRAHYRQHSTADAADHACDSCLTKNRRQTCAGCKLSFIGSLDDDHAEPMRATSQEIERVRRVGAERRYPIDDDTLTTFARRLGKLRPWSDWVGYVWDALSRTRPERRTSAYVAKVARRLKAATEQSMFGLQAVRKGNRKPIGHVFVESCFRDDGGLAEGDDEPDEVDESGERHSTALDSACVNAPQFRPAPGVDLAEVFASEDPETVACRAQTARALAMVAKAGEIDLRDEDERALYTARQAGVSQRSMADHLGWEKQRASRVWRRLWIRGIG